MFFSARFIWIQVDEISFTKHYPLHRGSFIYSYFTKDREIASCTKNQINENADLVLRGGQMPTLLHILIIIK